MDPKWHNYHVCLDEKMGNTPGPRVGSGFHDQTLAVKSRKKNEKFFFVRKYKFTKTIIYFLDIPSSTSYAKLGGETNVQLPEYE